MWPSFIASRILSLALLHGLQSCCFFDCITELQVYYGSSWSSDTSKHSLSWVEVKILDYHELPRAGKFALFLPCKNVTSFLKTFLTLFHEMDWYQHAFCKIHVDWDFGNVLKMVFMYQHTSNYNSILQQSQKMQIVNHRRLNEVRNQFMEKSAKKLKRGNAVQ